ncbi:MAG: sigma 54-interacting transcriptional regulator [Gammaproteobacteria bacterium]|nr:sigma 54-interacting transcriptional regulator [Gammaproteobacteria bacterium]
MVAQRLIEKFNLRSRLRFDIDNGHIWLDENRMLLLHAKAFGALRRELFDTLGVRRAQGLLLRMGFVSGQQDAEFAHKLYGAEDNYDVFRIGPELHAFEGLVKATITEAKIDWEQGSFFGEVDWAGSWEAESHMQLCGAATEPACWSLVGYASGYVSQFFKRFIVFRETHCVARGDEQCRIVGKPAEAWDDEAYLSLFRAEDIDGQLREMEEELTQLRGRLRERHEPGHLIGNSPGFRAAFELLSKAANSPINVLLLGETGVGKEVFARWLHENSDRAQRPFVAINCAAIPNELIESELFGVQKGAYTGAQQSRAGRFERADGGTLFLDEVGDLSPSAQVKLLRVLQTGEIERLGDEQTRKVDVRLISATNVNLQQAIAEGRFRADLYYRLATYPVLVPPLRERKSDIPLLTESMIEKFAPIYNKRAQTLSDRAIHVLSEYAWPGNVRELENLIERGVLLAPSGGQIEVEHLFAGGVPVAPAGATVDRQGIVCDPREASREKIYEALLAPDFDLAAHESQLIELAVRRADGNLAQAARTLGITRRQLAYRLKQTEPD